MQLSFMRKLAVILCMVLVAASTAAPAEDYLIIKKKSGEKQRIPLQFSPEEIESFQVEPGPTKSGRPPERAPAGEPGEPEQPVTEEPQQLPTRTTQPFGREKPTPKIPLREPARERETPAPFDAGEQEPPVGPVQPERERPRLERAEPVSGPSTGAGRITVNVYELPENVTALPDFSAFRPKETLTVDRIDINPKDGAEGPAGLPEDTTGLGMRFIGLFRVSGEGIFLWRVLSKDGVRVHIDDKTIIENDGIHDPASKEAYLHLAEGDHVLVLDSFNAKNDPVLQLFVTPPLGEEKLFSASEGLVGWKEPAKPYDVLWGQVYFVPKGKYPKGPDFEDISPIGRIIAPELSLSDAEGIPGLPGRKDMVGVQYEGFFNVEGAGIFSFRLVSDYFAKLKIGKHEIAEVQGGLKSKPEGDLGWAFFQKGSYPISVEYFHPEGSPRLELFVTEPKGQEKVFSPAETLIGYDTEKEGVNMIPAFVYFLKPGTSTVPNFNKLSPSGMFFTGAIDYPVDRGSQEFPGVPQRDRWLGLRFYVKFSLSEAEEGTYKFRVVADDGARLIVGKKLVVKADGKGTMHDETGSVTLKEGTHEMFLDYFQAKGKSGVQLYITPPDGEEKIFAFQ